MPHLILLRNLKKLRRFFNEWYSLILESRSKIKKFTTVYKWRRLNHCWQAWKLNFRIRIEDREAKALAAQVQRQNRMELESLTYYAKKTMSKYFLKWYARMRVSVEKR